ncbi:MAG: Sec-independent protein translocase protein TatB [Campylobacterota bacterium]|nr:Sec-independent protein translocase protein TatB [Campylobacterota bacterium]
MFGMGFTEILIIAVIAILFLGPDKLPTAMVEIAKFFRNAKRTIGDVKDSLEQEMNVSEIKEEALAYKKELLDAKEKIEKTTDIKANLTNLMDEEITPQSEPKLESEKVTFEKKTKPTQENKYV